MSFIYNKDKKGNIRAWRTWADGNTVNTEFGLIGGAMQNSSYVAVGVNDGKSNARSAFQQAAFESDAMRRKKLETGWSENIDDAGSGAKFPMLAEKLKDHAKRLAKFDVNYMVQPKLNGVRCHVKRVSEDAFEFTSRKGKQFRDMWHLVPDLKKVMEVGEVFDGELFKMGVELQTLSGLVRTKAPLTAEEAELIELHVYDIADRSMLSEARNRRLFQRCDSLYQHDLEGYDEDDFGEWGDDEEESVVKLVPTYNAANLSEVHTWHDTFVSEGYEGIIVRLPGYFYEFSNGTSRCSGLLKHKFFMDDEFKIIGSKEGVGRYAGAIVFKCITEEGKEFDVKPRGSIPMLREMWKNRESYVGKMYTVRYQSITPTGSPEFPVGIAVRDYE